MFEKYPDRVLPEPTPERVMALLRMLSLGPIPKQELVKHMTLHHIFKESPPSAYDDLHTAVRELGFLREDENVVSLTLEPGRFKDYEHLRRTVAEIVFARKNTTFFLISQRIMDLNEKIFEAADWDHLGSLISDNQYVFKGEDIRGWRWWGAYLGLGYILENSFIPNLAVRVRDVLHHFPVAKMPALEFVLRLEKHCPEAATRPSGKTLGLGVSNGLRVLHKLDALTLETVQDGERWNLNHIEAHILNEFTHVVLRGGIYGLE